MIHSEEVNFRPFFNYFLFFSFITQYGEQKAKECSVKRGDF
jgi:hypothetical protein